jgi:FkbM family methyltransferase
MKIKNKMLNPCYQLKKEYRKLLEKLDEIAFFANRAKNSASVYLGNNTALTMLYNGQKIYVDTRDISVAPHLLLSGEWEMDITFHWINLLREYSPKIVFDLGANSGYFGILAAAELSLAEIHFFEANPRLSELILKSIAINGINTRSKVVNKCISSRDDELLELAIPDSFFGSASFDQRLIASVSNRDDVKCISKIMVPTLSLDAYCSKMGVIPEFLKIDVEGFEYEVFLGAEASFKHPSCRCIFMEYTPNAYPAKFISLIKSIFPVVRIIQGDSLKNLERIESLDESGDWEMLVLTKVN